MTMVALSKDDQALSHSSSKIIVVEEDDGVDESRQRRVLTAASTSSLKCHPIPLTVPASSNAVNPYASRYARQVVIAHRGASAHLPEHSLAGYRLALELGADYIEPDLVSTSDGHLVAMHSLDLAETTNVEEVFPPDRKTTSRYMDDGREGYWIYTFTLEEVKTLRLKQRLSEQGGRTKVYDGLFEVPTLTEILELIIEWNSSIQPRHYNTNATLVPITSPTETDSSNNNNNNIHYERRPPPPSGRLYAELKDFSWLLEDANINLIDLLFDHMTTTTTTTSSSSSSTSSSTQLLWDEALFKYMCNTKVVSTEYSYILPPLVIQSFEPAVLQNFTERWEEYSSSSAASAASTNNTNDDQSLEQTSSLFTATETTNDGEDVVNLPLPVPPTILLVPHDQCHDFDHFWYDIQSTYRRESIKGIGPDKKCFFSTTKHGSGGSSGDNEPIQALQRDIMDLAVKQDWVVHPYTERPETSFFVSPSSSSSEKDLPSSPYFANVLEELMYLKCVVGVHGVFSESVDVAVRAMNLPCPGGYDLLSVDESNIDVVSHQTSVESETIFPTSSNFGSSSSSSSTTSCPTQSSSQHNNISTVFNGEEVPLGPVVLLSFTMGMVGSLFMYCFWRRIMLCRRRQRGGVGDGITSTEHSSVSTNGSGKNLSANNRRRNVKIAASRLRGTPHQHDHSVLPTDDDDEVDDGKNYDLELTDADREML